MKIVEISNADLPGRLFNGYDLHITLRRGGYDASQIVLKKQSNVNTVQGVLDDFTLSAQIRAWEWGHSVSHTIIPYGYKIKEMKTFKEADIVHCHILHNNFVSIFDYPDFLGRQGSVWTIHDPWIFTGNCIHPLDCDKWLTGCGNCPRLHKDTFDMAEDNTSFMWSLKRSVLGNINPHIVVASEFMKRYVENSPLTRHFRNIEVIPFGIDINKYKSKENKSSKKDFGISEEQIVIGFRAEDFWVKGCQYLYEALLQIEQNENIYLLSVGGGNIPQQIRSKYNLIELGWVNDLDKMLSFWGAVDIFIMPSLAEGFGVMALEAMASSCAVVCFAGTVVAENTDAPRCGIEVQYKSAAALADAIQHLLHNKEEMVYRGKLGLERVNKYFTYDDYVRRHIELYNNILEDG